MSWTRKFLWVLALSLGPAMLPGYAAAQNVVLYEVTESMKFERLKQYNNSRASWATFRQATAQLFGSAADHGPICPDTIASIYPGKKCFVNATASDSFDITKGKGSVNGAFVVVIQDANQIDAPEQIVLSGTMSGDVDLSPALLGPDGRPNSGDEKPLGSITGTWSAQGVTGSVLDGVSSGGTFTGTFRLPFVTPGNPPMYLASSGPVPVQPSEFMMGFPLVRLELNVVGGSSSSTGSWSGSSTGSYSGSSKSGTTSTKYSGNSSSGAYTTGGYKGTWSTRYDTKCAPCGAWDSGSYDSGSWSGWDSRTYDNTDGSWDGGRWDGNRTPDRWNR